jgi:hypothetical protein
MPGREKGAFGLNYSLHARLFQVLADCIGVERLVDDIGECLGHLDSILCLVSEDEMDSMVNIGRRKLGWMTSRRLLDLRALFGAEHGYSRNMNTSCRRNGVSRMTYIKLREDIVPLSSRQRSHDGGGWE